MTMWSILGMYHNMGLDSHVTLNLLQYSTMPQIASGFEFQCHNLYQGSKNKDVLVQINIINRPKIPGLYIHSSLPKLTNQS